MFEAEVIQTVGQQHICVTHNESYWNC